MDKETRPYIAWDVVQDFMVKAFTELGVPEADAEVLAVKRDLLRTGLH